MGSLAPLGPFFSILRQPFDRPHTKHSSPTTLNCTSLYFFFSPMEPEARFGILAPEHLRDDPIWSVLGTLVERSYSNERPKPRTAQKQSKISLGDYRKVLETTPKDTLIAKQCHDPTVMALMLLKSTFATPPKSPVPSGTKEERKAEEDRWSTPFKIKIQSMIADEALWEDSKVFRKDPLIQREDMAESPAVGNNRQALMYLSLQYLGRLTIGLAVETLATYETEFNAALMQLIGRLAPVPLTLDNPTISLMWRCGHLPMGCLYESFSLKPGDENFKKLQENTGVLAYIFRLVQGRMPQVVAIQRLRERLEDFKNTFGYGPGRNGYTSNCCQPDTFTDNWQKFEIAKVLTEDAYAPPLCLEFITRYVLEKLVGDKRHDGDCWAHLLAEGVMKLQAGVGVKLSDDGSLLRGTFFMLPMISQRLPDGVNWRQVKNEAYMSFEDFRGSPKKRSEIHTSGVLQ
ncbi:hypothetical protein BJ508DRAFT_10643 [Ascobolus immersus RN42]|uniref:Uncharacterized protein n=1 Tax=Ascobolus immersus RN42 TaxID=1160509 RepID=A0A3N4I2U8_ASCIM|nr:hypothetical protein BJ508DRAFT_10643 [Ascobolus immersus RN42]